MHRALRLTIREVGPSTHADASGKIVEDGEAPCIFQSKNNIVRQIHARIEVKCESRIVSDSMRRLRVDYY